MSTAKPVYRLTGEILPNPFRIRIPGGFREMRRYGNHMVRSIPVFVADGVIYRMKREN